MKILKVMFLLMLVVGSSEAMATDSIFMDSKKPLQITSKTLRYIPEEEKAIFEGEVDAVQEKSKLTCDKMIVEFERENKQPVTDVKEDNGAAVFSSKRKQIKKIYANGHVVMYNVDTQEKIESLRAEYEPKLSQMIFYDEVKISKGRSTAQATIITGDKLVYNTVTGESIMVAAPNTRVKGWFMPEEEKKDDK